MPRVESSDPERMVYRSGGGCLMLLGLPVFLAGMFMVVAPLVGEGFRPKDSKGKEMPIGLAVLVGTLFAAAGVGVAFGRSGKVLDRRADTLETWWGLLVPLRRTQHCLSAFKCVNLRREVRRSKNSTYTVYPVCLEGGGMPRVTLEEPREPIAARAVAEDAAKFLRLTLVDASMGEEVARKVEELDESLRQRARRKGERPEVPPPPPGQRCRTRVVADTLCVEIPPLGLRTRHKVFLIVAGSIAAFFSLALILPIALDEKMQASGKAFAIGFLGAFFVVGPLLPAIWAAMRAARRRRTVEATPRELRVLTRGVLRERAAAIPSDELEELTIVPARTAQGALTLKGEVVLARSDRAAACFGEGLSGEELAWLRSLVWNVLSA